jgi:hypothetical protein
MAGARNGSVRRPVGMAKREARRDAALDDDLAAVLRSMMRTAEKNHAIGIVVAAFGSKDDVMNVEKDGLRRLHHRSHPML